MVKLRDLPMVPDAMLMSNDFVKHIDDVAPGMDHASDWLVGNNAALWSRHHGGVVVVGVAVVVGVVGVVVGRCIFLYLFHTFLHISFIVLIVLACAVYHCGR